MDIRIFIIVGTVIVVTVYYYLSRKFKLKLKSEIFSMVIISLCIISLSIITDFKENDLRDRIRNLESVHVVDNEDCSGGDYSYVGYTCDYYYAYYAGFYLNSTQDPVLLIKESAPVELIEYLDNHGVTYFLRKYSFVELSTLTQKIHYDIIRNSIPDHYTGLGIDVINNKVEIGTTDVTYFETEYSEYIELGMLKVFYQEPFQLH